MKKQKRKSEVKKKGKSGFTRKMGIWIMILGIAMQFLNMATYGYWGIDIDIFGVIIFIVGLAITIANWKK